jgi:hypothetical protein
MVVAVIALVATASGGALAATQASQSGASAAAASRHKKKPKVVRGATGPRGAVGPAGRSGSTGPTGPIGPSNAFEADNTSGSTSTADSTSVTLVTLAGLPAGAYVLSGEAGITRLAGGSPGLASCTLTAGADSDTSNTTLQNGLSTFSTVSTQVTHVFAAGAPGTATLSCTAFGGTAQWLAKSAKIIAINVGAVTKTTVTG